MNSGQQKPRSHWLAFSFKVMNAENQAILGPFRDVGQKVATEPMIVRKGNFTKE